MRKAFVLGAGLGTRLRPLTDVLPKPLVPVLNRPLACWMFDGLLRAGVESFLVNTHHLPDAWGEAFPSATWRDRPIRFVHEFPEILETGGGIANIADEVREDSFWVANGDILADLPLAAADVCHVREGHLVTLVLRSEGPNPNVTFDPATGRVLDLRQALGTAPERFHQFTGIYLVHPEFLRYLRPVPESVVPAFLRAITDGKRIGGIVLDGGSWRDLGDRETYLEANAALARTDSFLGEPTAPLRIAPSARIGPGAEIDRLTVIGDGCRVGADARLEACVLWPGAVVAPGAVLSRCVVTGRQPAEGIQDGVDL